MLAFAIRSNTVVTCSIVAPSRQILGGQAVQAERLIHAWRDDPDVHAWLVPINPHPQRLAPWVMQVRYLRAAISESQGGHTSSSIRSACAPALAYAPSTCSMS